MLSLGWSGQHEDMEAFLKHMEQECERLGNDAAQTECDIDSTTEAMELEEVHEKLADMKPVWDKLRAEGVSVDARPLVADLPWSVQFQFQAENDPTGKDMEWWKAHKDRFDRMDRGHGGNAHDEESKPVAFGLFPIDRPIQTRLLDACRAMLRRATPAQTRDLAYLIDALQRLPSTTPGVYGGATLATRQGESAAYRGFELHADEFTLTTGESVNFGCGTDHGFNNMLEVGTSAMRDIYESGDDFTEWLDMFCEQAADDATEMEIFCDVADGVNISENCEGLPWEENPLLDEM